MSDDEALKQLNRSGFPFQLKVEHDVRESSRKGHAWEVASREHPWSTTESSGFIDIVLQQSTFRLAIECKRVKADDARQLRWLFLIPDLDAVEVSRASSFEVESDIGARIWDDVQVFPFSYESGFCVLQGDDPRRQPLLESLAKEVLESTEGLAQEELSAHKSIQHRHIRLFLFPMIVTNAKIAICRFDPSRIDLRDGTLGSGDAEILEVPFIRFRKSLATEFPDGAFYTLEGASRARERTVFVVNASCLTDVLGKWDMKRMSDRMYAIERLVKGERSE